MNISPISFKSTYIVDSKKNNLDSYYDAIENIEYNSHGTRVYESDLDRGVAHIVTPNNLDDMMELWLEQMNINYVKKTDKELLCEESLKKRLVVPNGDYNRQVYLPNPIFVDAEKFDAIYKKSGFYVEPYPDLDEDEKKRNDEVKEYMRSDLPFKISEVYIKNDGSPKIDFVDGRHRYAVMRDMGFKKIPVAMNQESYNIAREIGLLDEDS